MDRNTGRLHPVVISEEVAPHRSLGFERRLCHGGTPLFSVRPLCLPPGAARERGGARLRRREILSLRGLAPPFVFPPAPGRAAPARCQFLRRTRPREPERSSHCPKPRHIHRLSPGSVLPCPAYSSSRRALKGTGKRYGLAARRTRLAPPAP